MIYCTIPHIYWTALVLDTCISIVLCDDQSFLIILFIINLFHPISSSSSWLLAVVFVIYVFKSDQTLIILT